MVIKFHHKQGKKIISREMPFLWKETVDRFLEKYPIKSPIHIIYQESNAHYRRTLTVFGLVVVGNHIWLERKHSDNDTKHVIHVWAYGKNTLKTLLHELAHAHLEEKDFLTQSNWGKYNTEENADKIAADILFHGGEMPLELKSLSSMSNIEIRKWTDECKSKGSSNSNSITDSSSLACE